MEPKKSLTKQVTFNLILNKINIVPAYDDSRIPLRIEFGGKAKQSWEE